MENTPVYVGLSHVNMYLLSRGEEGGEWKELRNYRFIHLPNKMVICGVAIRVFQPRNSVRLYEYQERHVYQQEHHLQQAQKDSKRLSNFTGRRGPFLDRGSSIQPGPWDPSKWPCEGFL